MKLLSYLFILFGITCFIAGIFLIWQRNSPDRLSFRDYTPRAAKSGPSNPPVRIAIEDVLIDIPVYPANLHNGKWETTEQGASYLTSSPVPGERGNSIIYAHDWMSLFGPLVNVKKGQKVTVYFADKSYKTFIIQKTAVVPYTRSDILSTTNDRRITLYTCTGFLDSQRFVATAMYTNN